MEITDLSSVQKTKPVEKKSVSIQENSLQDSLSLSPETQKMETWVNILSEMPSIRPEAMAKASSGDLTPESLSLLSNTLMRS